jgi:HEAT repeat protein
VVVEKAAKSAGELGFKDLCPELSAAFSRFMNDPAFVDRGCGAKTELARAAVDLKCHAQAVFLAGIHHVQDAVISPEPYDSAVELRQLCALGLVQIRYPDVMNELVELLLDTVAQARIGAARAMAHTGREDATYLLRMKVLMGDRDPDVIGECLTALVTISPDSQLDFVAGYLVSNDGQIRDGAALAIGASRHPRVFEILRQCFEQNSDREFRKALLMAMATSRTTAAIDYLLSQAISPAPANVVDSIAALALYKHDRTLRTKLSAVVHDCVSDIPKAEFLRHFGSDV